MGHVESRFDPFGDGVSVGARFVENIPWLIKHFGTPDGTPR